MRVDGIALTEGAARTGKVPPESSRTTWFRVWGLELRI